MSRNRSQSHDETQVVVDPNYVRTKGCGKWLKSGKEKAMSQPSRKCGACDRNGHDRRTCPTLKSRYFKLDLLIILLSVV